MPEHETWSQPWPGEERFFARREIEAARGRGLAAGIGPPSQLRPGRAGCVFGGRRRHGPAFYIFGRRDGLVEWGRHQAMNPRWLQPVTPRFPLHLDVFRSLAHRLVRRAEAETSGQLPLEDREPPYEEEKHG